MHRAAVRREQTAHAGRPTEGFHAAHKPVAGGDCADCHEVHAAEQKALLTNPPTELCMSCHRKVKNMPHGATNMPAGHPLGGGPKEVEDPTRPKQPYQCSSCHDPHRSELAKLLKFDLRMPSGFCRHCHEI